MENMKMTQTFIIMLDVNSIHVMKRRQVLKVGGSLASVPIAGCMGGIGGDDDGDGGVKSWSFHIHASIMEEMAERYEEQEGVSVETVDIPADQYNERVSRTLQTGQDIPSAVTMRPGPVRGLATGGYVQDISDLMEEYGDQVFDIVKNRCRVEEKVLERTHEGDYVGLGLDLGPYILLYNRDIFEEAGLPTEWENVQEEIQTWEQFIEAGRQVKQNTDASEMIADDLSSINEIWVGIMNQLHGRYYEPRPPNGTTEFNFDQPANVKAAEVASAVHEVTANVPRLNSRHVDMMQNEEVACMMAPAWTQFAFKGVEGDVAEVSGSFEDMDGKWRGIPIPRPDDLIDMDSHLPNGLEVPRAANQAGAIAGLAAGIPEAEDEQARDWLEFWLMSDDKFEVHLDVGVGVTFTRPELEDKLEEPVDYYGGQPINKLWTESGLNSPDQYPTPTPTVRDLMYDAGNQMFLQGQPIEETITNTHEEMMADIESVHDETR